MFTFHAPAACINCVGTQKHLELNDGGDRYGEA